MLISHGADCLGWIQQTKTQRRVAHWSRDTACWVTQGAWEGGGRTADDRDRGSDGGGGQERVADHKVTMLTKPTQPARAGINQIRRAGETTTDHTAGQGNDGVEGQSGVTVHKIGGDNHDLPGQLGLA